MSDRVLSQDAWKDVVNWHVKIPDKTTTYFFCRPRSGLLQLSKENGYSTRDRHDQNQTALLG